MLSVTCLGIDGLKLNSSREIEQFLLVDGIYLVWYTTKISSNLMIVHSFMSSMLYVAADIFLTVTLNFYSYSQIINFVLKIPCSAVFERPLVQIILVRFIIAGA